MITDNRNTMVYVELTAFSPAFPTTREIDAGVLEPAKSVACKFIEYGLTVFGDAFGQGRRLMLVANHGSLYATAYPFDMQYEFRLTLPANSGIKVLNRMDDYQKLIRPAFEEAWTALDNGMERPHYAVTHLVGTTLRGVVVSPECRITQIER